MCNKVTGPRRKQRRRSPSGGLLAGAARCGRKHTIVAMQNLHPNVPLLLLMAWWKNFTVFSHYFSGAAPEMNQARTSMAIASFRAPRPKWTKIGPPWLGSFRAPSSSGLAPEMSQAKTSMAITSFRARRSKWTKPGAPWPLFFLTPNLKKMCDADP